MAPWTSILRMTSWPSASAPATSRRGVPYQLPWTSRLEQLAGLAQLRELGAGEELVGDARHLARARARVVQVTT